MRDNSDVIIPISRNIPQVLPRLQPPRQQLLQPRLILAPGTLIQPRIRDASVIRPRAKLGLDLGDGAARVAGVARDLLEDGVDGDGEQGVGAKGVQARVDGAAHGGGEQAGELGVVGEGGAEVGALGLAEGREVRVAQGFVGDGEVVDALGVADEMDRGGHVGVS